VQRQRRPSGSSDGKYNDRKLVEFADERPTNRDVEFVAKACGGLGLALGRAPMPLKLRVISDQYKELGKASSQLFGVTGGLIGRAPDNDWVLPDPDRYVSSHHAKISFRAGSWLLEDTSTNGTFVNERDAPLSVTGPYKLKDGDRLRFGDYDVIVSIDANNDFSPDATGQMPPPPTLRERRGKPSRPTPKRTPQHFDEDLGADLDITGLFVSGTREAEDQSDAVAAFDRSLQQDTPKPTPAPRASSATTSLLDTYLEEALPRAAAPDDSGEDWHMTTRRLQQRKSAANAVPLLQAVPTPPTPRAQSPASAAPAPIVREAPPVREFAPRESSARDTMPIKLEPERNRRSADGSGELQAGVDALCRGAGIDPAALPADAHGRLLGLAGQMLREVVLDLMEALRNRGEEKSRLHVGHTTIQPAQNNPLKFSASVEEALRKLLDGNSSRYLGAVEALREAFSDLKNHQAAMDEGMHAALNDLLSRVDPTELQERFDRGLKRNPLPAGAAKAKYWELYCEFYPLLNQRDTRGWPAVFTEEFGRIYAEKVEELERKKR